MAYSINKIQSIFFGLLLAMPLVIPMLLNAFDLLELPEWFVALTSIFGPVAILAILIPISVKTRKYYINKSSEIDIENILNKHGYVFDTSGKEGKVYYRQKGKPELFSLRIMCQDLGSQVMIQVAFPKSLKKDLKAYSYLDESYIF